MSESGVRHEVISPDPFAGSFEPSPAGARELAFDREGLHDVRGLVEVADAGRIEQPLVGRVRPTPTQPGGRGLWMANQVCDLVRIRSGAAGTAVRLQMSLG